MHLDFRVGDRVRIKPNSIYYDQAEGFDGTVIPNQSDYEEDQSGWVTVRWDHWAADKGSDPVRVQRRYDIYPVHDLVILQRGPIMEEDEFSLEEINLAQEFVR